MNDKITICPVCDSDQIVRARETDHRCLECGESFMAVEAKLGEDPKGEAGKLKTPLQLIPPEAMRAGAEVLKLGASKYGEWNWRTSGGVETMTYVGAMRRHLDAFIEGEDTDPESGESHIAHALACCMILLDAKKHGKLVDNRPPNPTLND